MKQKLIALLGFATACVLASPSHAIVPQPGQTMGVALGAPVPEGVFAVDIEDYGKKDGSATRVGANIPFVFWSTPFKIMESRLEVLYAVPFLHLDGGGTNRVALYNQALLIGAAHDFGNGFNASLFSGVQAPSTFFPDYTSADIRGSVSYLSNGYDFTGTLYYGGTFGASSRFSDGMTLDYTATRKFDKVELGIVGFATTDVNKRANNISGLTGSVAVGGLVGYDFGPLSVQAFVTREVAARANAGKDTRGWLRVVIPLYVAHAAAAPVVARY